MHLQQKTLPAPCKEQQQPRSIISNKLGNKLCSSWNEPSTCWISRAIREQWRTGSQTLVRRIDTHLEHVIHVGKEDIEPRIVEARITRNSENVSFVIRSDTLKETVERKREAIDQKNLERRRNAVIIVTNPVTSLGNARPQNQLNSLKVT